ncbi:MAG TPA: hypothetical protein VKV04_24205 [Verrucomicrobiae bacterium]|nr:hypothetical protein [Verrucomicrobiae bacterium]
MATFDSIFPTFLAKCGELHTLLLSVAYALFVSGIIVTVHHRFSHRVALHLSVRLLVLTALLVYLPVWGNQIQQLLQNSILSGLGVDPQQVYQQFNQLLVIKRDPATQSSWWNILSQLNNFSADLIITVVLWIIGLLASLLMFWAYIIQSIILNLGYALSPLLIGFMAIPALKHTGNRYVLNLTGVLLWPLGWGVAALVTQGILDFMTDPSFEYFDPTSTLPDFQKTIGVAAVGVWIIFSTIAAPVIIQKVVVAGALAGGELLSGGARAAVQTATSAVGSAITAAPLGPAAAIAAGGTAGALTLLSTSSGVGNAGSLVNNLTGLSLQKSDLSGDRAVRQLLTQLLQRLDQLPSVSPANGLPSKL